jgi:hypothetical protein
MTNIHSKAAPARRANAQRIKQHRCYTVPELAACLAVHKNTVRLWQGQGLKPIDASRPILFHGRDVKAFLSARKASRKQPCPPGTLFCCRCREPRSPALGMVDYNEINGVSGNLRAICAMCDGMMHRRIRLVDLATKMPGLAVQITPARSRISGSPLPSLNCDNERQVKP